MIDRPEADYPNEQYATALEAMGNDPEFEQLLGLKEDPFAYAKGITWQRGYRMGLKHAAQMLRKSAMGLYVTYPDHFPDPREDDDGK